MLSKLKTGLLILAGILGLIFTAFLRGRSAGKAAVEEEVRQQDAENTQAVSDSRIDAMKVRHEINQSVSAAPSDAVDAELLDEWTRDKDSR